MTFSSPRFSPWQQAAITAIKQGGQYSQVVALIRVLYPKYTLGKALNAADDAIEKLERKGILYRDGGTLRLVTTAASAIECASKLPNTE